MYEENIRFENQGILKRGISSTPHHAPLTHLCKSNYAANATSTCEESIFVWHWCWTARFRWTIQTNSTHPDHPGAKAQPAPRTDSLWPGKTKRINSNCIPCWRWSSQHDSVYLCPDDSQLISCEPAQIQIQIFLITPFACPKPPRKRNKLTNSKSPFSMYFVKYNGSPGSPSSSNKE